MIRPVILSRPENTAVAFLVLSACAGAAANRASARAVVKPRDIIRIVRWRGLERPVEPLTREPWWKKGAGERPIPRPPRTPAPGHRPRRRAGGSPPAPAGFRPRRAC